MRIDTLMVAADPGGAWGCPVLAPVAPHLSFSCVACVCGGSGRGRGSGSRRAAAAAKLVPSGHLAQVQSPTSHFPPVPATLRRSMAT